MPKSDFQTTPSGNSPEGARKGRVGKRKPRTRAGKFSSDEEYKGPKSPGPRRKVPPVPRSEFPCSLRLLGHIVPSGILFHYSLLLDRGGVGNVMSKLHGRRGAWQYQEQLDIRPTALGLFKNILVAEIPPIHINIYLLVVRNQSLSEPPDLTSKDWCLKIIERLHKYDVVDVNIANLKHMALASTATTDNAVGYLPSSSERST